MTREYSLAHLSMIGVPPARLADVAAGAGFEWFSLRLTPSPSTGVDHGHLGDEHALESLRRHIDGSGARLLDLEVVRMKGPESVDEAVPLLEAAQALGARYVIATVEDPDPVRRVETLSALADAAARHSTSIAVARDEARPHALGARGRRIRRRPGTVGIADLGVGHQCRIDGSELGQGAP